MCVLCHSMGIVCANLILEISTNSSMWMRHNAYMRSLLRFAISISVRKYFSIRVPTTFFGLRTHSTVAIMIEESAVSSNSELKSNSAFILIFEMHRFGAQNSWQKQFSCTAKSLKLSLVHRLVRRRRRRWRRSNSSSSHSNRTTSLIVVVQRGKKRKKEGKWRKWQRRIKVPGTLTLCSS